MFRQQEFICGLSHEVTIAVLPRLNMEELMFELNRRIQNLDKENSIKDRLVSILRDVMLEEYRQLERRSQFSSPDEMTVSVPVQNQENVLSEHAETMLSETSIPGLSQQSSRLDIVIKKERDTSSDLLVHTKEPEFDTEQEQLTVPQHEQLCNMPSPGSPTIPSCDTPLMQIDNRDDSRIKEEGFAMTNEATRTCHDELNIDTPSYSTHIQDTLNSMDTEMPIESYTPREETPFAPCHLPPAIDHGNVHIKAECHVSHDGQTSPTGFINSGLEHSGNDGNEETPLPSSQPTPGKDCENMASLRPVNDSQIGSKSFVCESKTSLVHSSPKHRKCHRQEKPFMCGECGYRARDKYRLVDHMKKHAGEKPFKCNQCNYKTSYERNLVDHMKSHTNAEPYTCEICDYQTYRKSKLETHMMCHAGVKPYKCDDCEYRTADKANLYRHRRLHTGERPYSCQECDYKTAQKANLITHRRLHTGERPYSCQKCDYKARQKVTLLKHMKRKHL
ncbi:uncharacterized protein LOC144865628 [Branchiostoma floridae x Branchiostoma japonicum]